MIQFHLDNIYEPYVVINEVYLRGVQSFASGRSIDNALSWVRHSAYKIIRELSRRQQREIQSEKIASSEADYYADLNLKDLELKKDLERLRMAFQQLDAWEQELLSMRILENLSWSRISDRLLRFDEPQTPSPHVLSELRDDPNETRTLSLSALLRRFRSRDLRQLERLALKRLRHYFEALE